MTFFYKNKLDKKVYFSIRSYDGKGWCYQSYGNVRQGHGNAAVERLNALIHSGMPGGREWVDDVMDDIESYQIAVLQQLIFQGKIPEKRIEICLK